MVVLPASRVVAIFAYPTEVNPTVLITAEPLPISKLIGLRVAIEIVFEI